MEKFIVRGSDIEISDGYHTMTELYDHRCLLWINYVLEYREDCYLVKNHYDGWFLLGMETHYGQISYHCPNKYLYLIDGKVIENYPLFDGHTSKEVIKRLIMAAEEA